MKQKYFPFTFLGAGILGALCGLIFCMVFLHVAGLDKPVTPPTGARFFFRPHFDLIPTSLCAALATAITSMLFWYLFVLLPNRISVLRGVFAGLVSTVCAIPLNQVFLSILHSSPYSSPMLTPLDLVVGIIAIVAVGLMSYGSVLLVGGVAGWLYVLLIRKVFALNVLPLLPPE
jgi:hypothetical protein